MVSLLASTYHELQPSYLQANTLQSRALGLAGGVTPSYETWQLLSAHQQLGLVAPNLARVKSGFNLASVRLNTFLLGRIWCYHVPALL